MNKRVLFLKRTRPIGNNFIKKVIGCAGPIGHRGKGDTVVILWLFEENGFLDADGRITPDDTIPNT